METIKCSIYKNEKAEVEVTYGNPENEIVKHNLSLKASKEIYEQAKYLINSGKWIFKIKKI